jgi:hypothetical protein
VIAHADDDGATGGVAIVGQELQPDLDGAAVKVIRFLDSSFTLGGRRGRGSTFSCFIFAEFCVTRRINR